MNISEILLILVVALLVIKPQQLPAVAFKLGKWSKRLRETMLKLRRDIDGTMEQLTEEPKKKEDRHESSQP